MFDGDESENGSIYVSVHGAALDKLSVLKHAASLYNIMVMEACKALNDFTNQNIKPTPYSVLIRCDGGPNNNLTHLSNQSALLSLFCLVGSMEKNISYTWLSWIFLFKYM